MAGNPQTHKLLKSSIYECPIASAATPFEEEDILILQDSPRLQQAEQRPALWVIRLTWHQLMEELANDKTDPFHFEIMLWHVSRPKIWQNQKATMTVNTLAPKLHTMVKLFLRFRKRFLFSTFVCTRLAGWNCLDCPFHPPLHLHPSTVKTTRDVYTLSSQGGMESDPGCMSNCFPWTIVSELCVLGAGRE